MSNQNIIKRIHTLIIYIISDLKRLFRSQKKNDTKLPFLYSAVAKMVLKPAEKYNMLRNPDSRLYWLDDEKILDAAKEAGLLVCVEFTTTYRDKRKGRRRKTEQIKRIRHAMENRLNKTSLCLGLAYSRDFSEVPPPVDFELCVEHYDSGTLRDALDNNPKKPAFPDTSEDVEKYLSDLLRFAATRGINPVELFGPFFIKTE